jgi:hypothetical protein
MCVCVSDSILCALVCMMMSSCSIINISYEHTDDDKQKEKVIFYFDQKNLFNCAYSGFIHLNEKQNTNHFLKRERERAN